MPTEPQRHRALPILVALATLFALALPAAASAAGSGPTSSAGGDLYVLQAASGSLDGSRLVLHGVERNVTTFTDRPQRSAGSLPTAGFARGWRRIFGSDSPNAALQVQGAPKSRDVAVLELRRPRYDAARHTLTYSVRRLRKTGDPALRTFDRRADGDAVKTFGRASLFVDDGEPAPLVAVQLQAKLPPFSSVALTFQDTEVAFGSREGYELGPQTFVSAPEGGSGSNSNAMISIGSRTVTVNSIAGTTGTEVVLTLYVTEPTSGGVTGKAELTGSPTGTIVAGGERQTLTSGSFDLPLAETD